MGYGIKIFNLFRHPCHQRNLAAILVGLVALAGWCVEGTTIIANLNPTLGEELAVAEHPALDVWITPPEYVDVGPTIISTPAGVRFEHETVIIPQGSVVSAHLAEQDGNAPELVIDHAEQSFTTDDHGDFSATAPLTSGRKLSIRRGWVTLASWKIKIIRDNPPTVSLMEKPIFTSSNALRLVYTASDAVGVRDVSLRVTPHNALPGGTNVPVEISLATPIAQKLARVDFEDLTSHPWAGQQVSLQLVATNQAGQKSVTPTIDMTLPGQSFAHPVARLLIEERAKLLQNPDDQQLRSEAANILAALSHGTTEYHGDPVVMMALRSGAVRLILNTDKASTSSVGDLLWATASHIENSSAGSAQRALHKAKQDLTDAIQNNAKQQEIQNLTDRLQQAMMKFLSHLSTQGQIRTGEGKAHSSLKHASDRQN